ncbi:MAG: hypothetical protein QGH20_05760, partial [Candidatus Latescibacteria bacterium]|nr:hypothetical protein [Candidatus Latescibacterota bacterium]
LQSSAKRTSKSGFGKKAIADTTSGYRLESRSENLSFSPLIAWTTTWKYKIHTTASANLGFGTQTKARSNANPTIQDERTWGIKFDARYELATSRGLTIPFWKRFRLKSNINITTNFTMNGQTMVTRNAAGENKDKDARLRDAFSWSLKPQMSYRFSRYFTGSANLEIGSREDRLTNRTTLTRAVSITGEFRFN